MADLVKKIKIKKQDGTFTDYIPIGAEAQNISTSDGDSVQLKLNKKPYHYNNVADMKADTKLKVGDMAVTLGYYEANDGGHGEYVIVNDNTLNVDNGSVLLLANGLYAKLIQSIRINIKQFGAKGDGINDDTNSIQSAINYGFENGLEVYVPKASVYFKTTLPIILNIDRTPTAIRWWGGNANTIIGESKATSRIVKIGNNVFTDNENSNINNKNATILCINSQTSSKAGTGVTINNLSIENYSDSEFNKVIDSYAIYTNISRSNYTNLNIISYYGIYAACFSSLFENIVYSCTEKALYLTNGTSNLFRFMYAPSCLNPYHIQSQYSTLMNVCCDNAKGTLFELGGMGLSLISCGSESKNAQYIFKIISDFTTLSIKDYYLIRQIGDINNNINIEDCSILHAEQRAVVEMDNISIMENESIDEGNSYFFSLNTNNINLATDVRNIRYYKNFTGDENPKINMWKNQPALKCMQRLSTQTHSFNYFVNSNLKLVPFIAGYKANTLSNEQGNCINSDDYSSSKTIWLDTKTKYTTEDGSDIRYISSHNVGDLQLYNDPLLMNCLGLSITNVQNAYTWDTLEIPIVLRGTTENRPTTNLFIGLQYFDTTLNKPIWYKGNGWVDSTGTQV